jgi:predicted DNA-binding transcriptional regulator AlpA
MDRLVRLSEIASSPKRAGLIPLSRTTIWRLVRSGDFPSPVRLGGRVTVWFESEIRQYLEVLRNSR